MAAKHDEETAKDVSSEDFSARLQSRAVDKASCLAALSGEKVPWALGSPLMQYCLIRGIRYHSGFGEEIKSATPALTRAWNARCIMSNVVPDMADDVHIPYCIWHPEVANESTYRSLVQRYPHMRYHVARACAVAGYTQLYRELDVLPEVNVADEARDNGNLDIFHDIMAAPVRYAVMDDYSRTLNLSNPGVACLNGDTAVRSSLDRKQEMALPVLHPMYEDWGTDSDDDSDDEWSRFVERFSPRFFNITEDGHIDTYDGYAEGTAELDSDLISPLLYSPLPRDLPAGNKDVLLLMAAYYGDVDRYARLRRPVAISKQINCVVRGIYHNTLFAKWWADRLNNEDGNLDGMTERYMLAIRKSITARYIMNNDLSRVDENMPSDELPYCIWYPGYPSYEALRELVRRCPSMRNQAARTCIIAGYTALFKELDPVPDRALLTEAEQGCYPDFAEFLKTKIELAGPDFKLADPIFQGWKTIPRHELREPMVTSSHVEKQVDENSVSIWFDNLYEGFGANTGVLELSVCARETVLKDGQESLSLLELYDVKDAENVEG